MKYIDDLLDRTTMYRLVLYVLIGQIAVATILAYFKLLHFPPLALLLSTAFLVVICWAMNTICARVFAVPTNVESASITALILALILDPAQSPGDLQVLGWAAILAMASKYLLAIGRKHIFNPPEIVDFVFKPSQQLAFTPGQYMEFTLEHQSPDSRGNRRYFTLASSPTETTVHLGVRFYKNSSSFKRAMYWMDGKTRLIAGQIAGDFTLPADATEKLVFIAGGIGITPFRSMLKYLLDTQQRRDIVLIYVNKAAQEIVYAEPRQGNSIMSKVSCSSAFSFPARRRNRKTACRASTGERANRSGVWGFFWMSGVKPGTPQPFPLLSSEGLVMFVTAAEPYRVQPAPFAAKNRVLFRRTIRSKRSTSCRSNLTNRCSASLIAQKKLI